MKIFLIEKGKRNRVMIRGNACENLVHLESMALGMGMKRVGFLRFWKHVVLWWRESPDPKRSRMTTPLDAERN